MSGYVSGRSHAVVLLCTTPTPALAQRLARALVSRHLAACVTCVPRAESYFWWQGRLDHARETVMLIKTTRRRLTAAMRYLATAHPYTVPELVALPIVAGSRDYLTWLQGACRG